MFQAGGSVGILTVHAAREEAPEPPRGDVEPEPYGRQTMMLNLRVEDLDATLARLKKKGHRFAGPALYDGDRSLHMDADTGRARRRSPATVAPLAGQTRRVRSRLGQDREPIPQVCPGTPPAAVARSIVPVTVTLRPNSRGW